MSNIPRIVITGGPCGGKTTALAHLENWCSERGFNTLLVPEAATELINSGFDPADDFFQEYVLREIFHKENLRFRHAQTLPKPVIICDRGAPEGLAYNPDAVNRICSEWELSIVDLRDRRYSGVIFMQTAALGAEAYYTTANNTARRESPAEARKLDARTLQVWYGAPHVHVIPNVPGETFDQKIHAATRALARILGIPEPIEDERKILLHNFDRSRLPASAVDIDIVQTYLVSKPGVAERVRARGQHNHWVYFHTIKQPVRAGVSIEHERIVTAREYQDLLVRQDVRLSPIHKTRTCFVFEAQYCEVDQFHGRHEGLTLLEIELTDENTHVSIPPYAGPFTDVTEDPAYSNYELAAA